MFDVNRCNLTVAFKNHFGTSTNLLSFYIYNIKIALIII